MRKRTRWKKKNEKTRGAEDDHEVIRNHTRRIRIKTRQAEEYVKNT